MKPSRSDFIELDARDPLAALRAQFDLPPGVVYLDGNSLGPLPKSATARIERLLREEWGGGLVTSWNKAGWMDLSRRVGDKIARLVGAGAGELLAIDSTSVNLYKALGAALSIARQDPAARRVILSERENFPTDLYIAEGIARERGCELRLCEADRIEALLNSGVAVLLLTQVCYRTGRVHDMERLTRSAHAAGALAVWDLSHSAGALPVDLTRAGADFAVGCGYKYLNGGPGAPGFVWAHPRHVDRAPQPMQGWLGHAAPFEFSSHYRPAAGIAHYQCGTPPILSLAALECGVDSVLVAEPLGGMAALRRKSLELTRLFIERVEARCAGHGLSLATPREDALRGSQVCFACGEGGYAIMQALIERNVIGDFRAGGATQGAATPDILRFGFTPLYTRYADAWDAAEALGQVLDEGAWRDPARQRRAAVT